MEEMRLLKDGSWCCCFGGGGGGGGGERGDIGIWVGV